MPFVSRTREIPFDQTYYRPGDTLISTFPRAGDYIQGMSLKIILPMLVPPIASTNWIYYTTDNSIIGQTMQVFSSDGVKLYDITLNGLKQTSQSTTWYTISNNNPSLAPYVTFQNDKFVFSTNGSGCYAVFPNKILANFWGFLYKGVKLFNGYIRFNDLNSSQVRGTLQESGWLQGDSVYTQESSYQEDTCYKLINSVSLFIGKQLIQEFDSTYIKTHKETSTTYKNRPVLKLLEGDTSIVDFKRTYYFELPFIHIPMYALPKNDIQIRVKTNPLDYIDFYSSIVINFNFFSDITKLPMDYTLLVPQVSLFTENELNIQGPLQKLVITGSPDYEFKMNGEFFIDSDSSNLSAIENLLNIPVTSNVFVFKGPINMSRIRDQKFESSNTNVYAETLNIMKIENGLSGLLFSSTETGGYPKVTGSLTNPLILQETYLFDEISDSVPNAISFYSMRLVNPGYSGPIVRLSAGSLEDDFFTDTTQSYLRNGNNVSVSDWANGNTIYVSIWYDQSIFKNNATQISPSSRPTLILSSSSGRYVLNFPNENSQFNRPVAWMTFDNQIKAQQFVFHAKITNGNFLNTLFCTQSDSSFRYNSSLNFKDDQNTWGTSDTSRWNYGTAYWRNGNNLGNSINGLYTFLSLNQWNIFSSWASSLPTYDTTLGGGFTFISLNPLYPVGARSYTGELDELGFFTGTTMSSDSVNYYNNVINFYS
jgi:hypothetical protein